MYHVLGSGMKDEEKIWATDNTGLGSQYQGFYIRNKPKCKVGRGVEELQRIAVKAPCPK